MLLKILLTVLLKTAQIQLGEQSLEVEIADRAETRTLGLMERSELKEGRGMLFVYDKPSSLSFWMKNTQIPLSIAFFDRRKILLNICDMAPASLNQEELPLYTSVGPAQYALEVPQGWFENHHIRPGMKFSFLDPN